MFIQTACTCARCTSFFIGQAQNQVRLTVGCGRSYWATRARCTCSYWTGALSMDTQTRIYSRPYPGSYHPAGIHSITCVLEAKPFGRRLSYSDNALYLVAAAYAGAQAGFPCRLLDSIVAWTRACLQRIACSGCSYTQVIPAGMGRTIV